MASSANKYWESITIENRLPFWNSKKNKKTRKSNKSPNLFLVDCSAHLCWDCWRLCWGSWLRGMLQTSPRLWGTSAPFVVFREIAMPPARRPPPHGKQIRRWIYFRGFSCFWKFENDSFGIADGWFGTSNKIAEYRPFYFFDVEIL